MRLHPRRWIESGLPAAGVFTGPVAWFVSTQLNYSLAASFCGEKSQAILPITLVLALVSLAGAFLSWRWWQDVPRSLRVEDPESHLPRKMLSGIGTLMGLLFATIILLQGSANFFLLGCMR
jgi:hypothetical protein